MNLKMLNIIFGCSALFVAFVEVFTPFAIWNCVPILIAYVMMRNAIKNTASDNRKIGPAVGFSLCSVGLVILFHVALLFDLLFDFKIVIRSSTSGVVLIFIPIYALVIGGVGYLVGLLFEKLKSTA